MPEHAECLALLHLWRNVSMASSFHIFSMKMSLLCSGGYGGMGCAQFLRHTHLVPIILCPIYVNTPIMVRIMAIIMGLVSYDTHVIPITVKRHRMVGFTTQFPFFYGWLYAPASQVLDC